MGPPTARLTSHTFFSSDGALKPASFNSWVKLLLCMAGPAPAKKNCPEYALPPVRGTTLITGPPISASASPPVVLIVISAEFPVSTISSETPPVAPPVLIPSTFRRPSVVPPPWPPKNGGVGPLMPPTF